jgi:hypothetical protein
MTWRRVAVEAVAGAALIAAVCLIPSCGTAPASPDRAEIIVGEWQYDSGPTVALWTACSAFGDRLYVTSQGVAAVPGGCKR